MVASIRMFENESYFYFLLFIMAF